MAKKSSAQAAAAEETEEGGKYSVVVDADLVPRIKALAALAGSSAPSWINSRLRDVVRREVPAAQKRLGFGDAEGGAS